MEQKMSINQLIYKINNPSLISAQLATYNDWLESDDQYTMDNLVPILVERMKECNNALSDVSAICKDITSLVERMADNSLTIMGVAQALFGLLIATDLGDPLKKEYADIIKTFSVVDSDIRSIMTGFLDQNFEELSSYITEKIVILNKLKESLSTKHFDSGWMLEKLHSVHCDVQRYADNIVKKEFHPFASGLYKKYRQLYSRANNIQAKRLKKKSVNPLFISEQEVHLLGELDKNLEQLGMQIHEWINSVYQHEQLLLVLVSHIKVFLLLSDKLIRAAENSKDLKHAT